jgi:hypothetical protein
MSDEPNTKPGMDGDTGGSQDDDNVNVSKADFEAMQAKAAYYDKLTDVAKEFELETPEDYVDAMEIAAQKNISATIDKTPETPAKPPKTPESNNVPQGMTREEFQREIARANAMAATATLSAHWTAFELKQSRLSEDEQTQYTERELRKMITGDEGQLIHNIAQKRFGGNVYQAADWLKTNSDPDTLARARKAGAASQAAKDKAKGSANLDAGGKSKEPEDVTAAERQAELIQKERDSIAPSEQYEYPG